MAYQKSRGTRHDRRYAGRRAHYAYARVMSMRAGTRVGAHAIAGA